MANFTGTGADEIIIPSFVSSTVTATGGIRPSNAADIIDGGAGNDTIDGGGGNDVLLGGDGNDLLIGGHGNDRVTGGRGNDVALLGSGNDLFVWNPGDGSDVVEGGAGADTLQFNGSNVGEHIDISANGGRARLLRDVGAVTMDLNSVERIEIAALAGADTITVGDLGGTGVRQVAVDLASSTGSGDEQADTVIVNGSAGGNRINIVSDGTSVAVRGLAAQVTIDQAEIGDSLVVNGLDGNDSINASALNAGQISLVIDGGAGNDALIGSAGNDVLIGGDGNDIVTGGAGNDTALLGAGDDRFVWNPGDGSDLVEGQAGVDTLAFNGSAANEVITVSANGQRVLLARDIGNIAMDLNGVENVVISAGGGDDVMVAGNGLAALTSLTMDGGAGNDTITGGDGADMLLGGDGDDTVTGGRGNDVALLGSGNDLFVWNPGDGSDVVEGQSGFDTLVFNGSNVGERFDISANAGRARLVRDVGGVTMDLNGVERIELATLGGADTITVNDLSGTNVRHVAVDLAAFGAGIGDGQADTVIVNGSAGNNRIGITASGTLVTVSGLPAEVTIDHAEGANDSLVVNGLGGNDSIDASRLNAGQISLTINGGTGNDTIFGSRGNDVLFGGDGNDVVTGGVGADVALLGAGDDRFIWNQGDGSDLVDGEAGTDTLIFAGSDAPENISLSANGSRATLFRDVAGVTMDINGIERVQVAAAGGTDNIVVNDLTGTGITQVAIDLASASCGDGQSDQVTVNGTAGNDFITVDRNGGAIRVSGLSATVTVADAEGALDRLTISGGAGDDVIDAGSLPANQIGLVLNAGIGNDVILGSGGNDSVNGGTGNDVAALGDGNDLFTWNPGEGSDTVDGQRGFDTLLFNGSNVGENINISANGGQTMLTRDVGAVTMKLASVEAIELGTFGGADHIIVNDLSGAGVRQVAIDLAASATTAGDGQADSVTVNGTAGHDRIVVSSSGTGVVVSGLPAQVTVDHGETSDLLSISGGAGNDIIDASAMPAGAMALALNGGEGNDIIMGGAANDGLVGGNGNDTFMFNFGAGGHDVIQDFQVHGTGTQGDVIRLAGFSDHTFDQALADGHIAQSGTDVVISDGTGIVATLQNVSLASLHANDFMFA
jgi:Ca2+-binding RTX toxin-like protein